MSKKSIVISSGDPAGCGPLITLDAVYACRNMAAEFFVVGGREVFEKTPGYNRVKEIIKLIDPRVPGAEKIKPGHPSVGAGAAGLTYLDKSLDIMKKNNIKRLVTAPLSKEAVKAVFPEFVGHTEYLADHFKVKRVAMLMSSEKINVLLLTRHVNLREVSRSMNRKIISDAFSLVYFFLKQQFQIANPKIAVASVNPHAGVDTFLEKEEKEIAGAIKRFKFPVYGPYPSDSIFIEENREKYDCIICPYHDQGMIPFKLISMKQGVNVTLGLPVIRVSPAHGVAYEVMRSGKKPFSSSMVAAIKLALKLAV